MKNVRWPFCDFGTLKIVKNTDFEKPLDLVSQKALDDLFAYLHMKNVRWPFYGFFSALKIVKNTDFEKPLDRVSWKALDDLFVNHVVEMTEKR